MGGSDGNDGSQMFGSFAQRHPLIEAGVGSSPHGDFAVGPGLPGDPFDYVVAVLRLLEEGVELSLGVAAATDIDDGEDISVLGEVIGAGMIAVADVGCQLEDDRQRILLVVGTVYRGVQMDAVAHGNLYRPQQIEGFGGVWFLVCFLCVNRQEGEQNQQYMQRLGRAHA